MTVEESAPDEGHQTCDRGRCISADDQAIGSIRVMPCCMAMGQAAGLAASMALSENVLPKEVDVPKLREALRRQGAILSRPAERQQQ